VLGPDLVRFVTELEYIVRCDPWVFVHGGVHPSVPLDRQDPDDWLWMRQPFLSGKGWKQPFRVVHGHTIRRPEILGHRIGLDAGCYRTGVLVALEILPDHLRLLAVTSEPSLERFHNLSGSSARVAFGAPEPLGS
jgi:serine/threonine protein phosphatase 1